MGGGGGGGEKEKGWMVLYEYRMAQTDGNMKRSKRNEAETQVLEYGSNIQWGVLLHRYGTGGTVAVLAKQSHRVP